MAEVIVVGTHEFKITSQFARGVAIGVCDCHGNPHKQYIATSKRQECIDLALRMNTKNGIEPVLPPIDGDIVVKTVVAPPVQPVAKPASAPPPATVAPQTPAPTTKTAPAKDSTPKTIPLTEIVRHKDEILADLEKMSVLEVRTKWNIKSDQWTYIKKKWGLPILPHGGRRHGTPGLPVARVPKVAAVVPKDPPPTGSIMSLEQELFFLRGYKAATERFTYFKMSNNR